MKRQKINIFTILIFLFFGRCFSQEMPHIEYSGQEGRILVSRCDSYLLHLLSQKHLNNEQWRNLLAVYVTDKRTGKPMHDLAVLGQYTIKGQRIGFTPRFPFKNGIFYLAKFNIPYFYALLEENVPLPRWEKIIELRFEGSQQPALPQTLVEKVYPDSDTLPVNQLKLYIHFSNPMQAGMAYKHLQLLKADGNPVDQPFLELSPELWDRENKRLTVWFDPGRIKRGLSPNALKGLPLRQGNTYTLKIDAGWKDQRGSRLKAPFEKEFHVTGADREAPDVSNWILHLPAKGTIDKLSLEFDEPMDRALLNRMISLSSKEKEISGKIYITNNDKSWILEPHEPWENGSYQIKVNTKIEDLAGNSLRRLFDSPVSDHRQVPEKEKELIIPIKISRTAKNKKVRKYEFRTLPN